MKLLAKLSVLFLSAGLALADAQQAAQERTFAVERFSLSYAKASGKLPEISVLGNLTVPLETRDGTYLAKGQGGVATTIHLSDTLPAGTLFTESALRQVVTTIVQDLNRRSIYGVYVLPSPTEIDPATKADLRGSGNHSLSLVVWVSQIEKVRAVAKGARFAGDQAGADAAYALIVANSPLGAGSLLETDELNDYLRHVNRQPGREVDATISNGSTPGEVSLDYLVNENKPWLAYAQVSDTGNPATGQWQERFGAIDNQLTNRDDIASIDYVTTSFNKANAVLGSYDTPILYPDRLRLKVYGSYGDFAAFQPNATNTSLSGNSWIAGADLTGAIAEWNKMFVDLSAGFSTEHYVTNNTSLQMQGSADLLIPHIYLTIQRHTPIFSFNASVGGEVGTGSNSAADLQALGRLDTTTNYTLLRASASGSTYLEALGGQVSGSQPSSLLNEVSLSVSETYVPGDDRLIPDKEQALGGLYSVRGYPQSLVSGDDAFTTSFEYRFHFGRFLGSAPAADQKGGAEKTSTLFGQPFNWRANSGNGQADWDLIAKAFVDYGRTSLNTGSLGTPPPGEAAATLASTGVGLELQLKRNFSVRADWGYVLDSVATGANGTFQPGDAHRGDSRVNVLATVLW
jgi:hemolysin activation/secretion protein